MLTLTRLLKICSHSVAVAEKEDLLENPIKCIKFASCSSITYPESKGGAGRKGGRKRQSRYYKGRQSCPAKTPNLSRLFTEVWHNNDPLIVCKVDDIPIEKSRCGHCGKEFPRGPLSGIPFDLALSHRESWLYPNRDKKEDTDPNYLVSPPGKKTTRYYCINKNCVLGRFPCFKAVLLEIPDDITLKFGHKNIFKHHFDILL